MSISLWRLVTAALVLGQSTLVAAQTDDVTFFVIGKHANYQQLPSGKRTPVDYSFFSEIFLTSEGNAQDAMLTFPTGETIRFTDMRNAAGGRRDNILLYSGPDRFTRIEDLQHRYPDGVYKVSFATSGGNVDKEQLSFDNRGLPEPPHIIVGANCEKLVPGQDTTITWAAFIQGRADSNGILDDLVFVILTDAAGKRVAHSGRPFEGKPYLTYRDTSFTIDGAVIEPDSTYTLSVEHAILDDTTRLGGVPAFTTRAVTTKLEISSGPADLQSCTGASID